MQSQGHDQDCWETPRSAPCPRLAPWLVEPRVGGQRTRSLEPGGVLSLRLGLPICKHTQDLCGGRSEHVGDIRPWCTRACCWPGSPRPRLDHRMGHLSTCDLWPRATSPHRPLPVSTHMRLLRGPAQVLGSQVCRLKLASLLGASSQSGTTGRSGKGRVFLATRSKNTRDVSQTCIPPKTTFGKCWAKGACLLMEGLAWCRTQHRIWGRAVLSWQSPGLS